MSQMMTKRSLSGWRRAQAVYFSYQSRTVPEIAGKLKCSKRSVYEWLRNYQKSGLNGIAPKPRQTKLTLEQVNEMMKISGWSRYLVSGQKAWSFRKIANCHA
jgi:transposase